MKNFINLFIVALTINVAVAQKADLSLRLTAGETYKHISEATTKVVQEIQGQKMVLDMKISGTTSYTVRETNDEGYIMDVVYERLYISMEMAQGSMVMDSEKNDPSDIISSILSKMKNVPFEVVLSKKGKVLAVNKIDALWESAVSQFGNIPDIQKEQIKTQVMKSYGADAMKGTIEVVTAIAPDKKVKKGESWSVTTQIESGMSADVSTTYTYAETKNGYHLINGDGTIATADTEAYIDSNGIPMKFDMSGTNNSVIRIDENSGWIQSATINQTIKGKASIKPSEQLPNGMDIPMEMTSESRISN